MHARDRKASPAAERLPAAFSLQSPQPKTDSTDSSNDEDHVRKAHKHTYTVRREQAEAMRTEVGHLADQLKALKRQRKQRQDAANSRANNYALALNANAYMRSVIQIQQHTLLDAHSALSDWMNDPFANPLTSHIHLSKDPQHRRQTLLAMKDQTLAKAGQYLRARNRQLNLLKPSKATALNENDTGDFFAVHGDIVQFKGADSARQVYDALMFTMANMEISVSEKLGEMTVREEYEALKDGVGNFRMQSWQHPTAPQEGNCVLLTQFYDGQLYNESSEGGFGITVIDFVDQDDLYPYRPDRSIRRDVTSACVISSHRKPKPNVATGETEQELVVVLQRVAFMRLHHSDLITDEAVLNAVRQGATVGCDVIMSSMREFISAAQNRPAMASREPAEWPSDGIDS